MKKLVRLTSTLLAVLSFSVWADGVDSLRQHSLDKQEPAAELKDFPKDNEDVELSYIHQPPLIPHSIRDYGVNKESNKCLSCHSFKNAKKNNATKISISHFSNRDDQVLSDVSPRRYFCLQCHVPQTDAKPLVENEFKAVDSLQ